MANRCERCSARKTPQRRKAASRTSSLPASEPVLRGGGLGGGGAATGLDDDDGLGQRDFAADMKDSALPIDSMYMTMLRVRSSSPRSSRSGRPSRRRALSRPRQRR